MCQGGQPYTGHPASGILRALAPSRPGLERLAAMVRRIAATVKGQVQGVGYRYFAIRRAEDLGLVGYAKNLPNGDVEVVAEGNEEDLGKFIVALQRGPSSAFVREVKVDWMPATGEFGRFDARYGA